MAHNLKADTAYVYLGYFLRYLSPLILVPYYSRVLGPESYGQVLAAISLMTLISLLVSYGFAFSGIRELASVQTEPERIAVVGRQLTGRLVLIPVAAVAGAIGTCCSPVLSGNPWFGVLATLHGVITGFGFSWLFQGMRQFKLSILFETIPYPITITLALLFVRDKSDGLYALLSVLTSSSLALLIAFHFVKKRISFSLAPFVEGIKEIKNTTVFFLTSMSATILMAGSTYILSIMAAPQEVGFYGTAERIISIAIAMLNPIGQVLMPTITSLHKQAADKAEALMRKGVMLETGCGILCLVLGGLCAPFAIPLFLGSSFAASTTIFQLMLLILPFTAIKHALILYVLIPMRHEKIYLTASVSNVALNLTIAIALVPEHGAMGMATARVVAEILATVLLLTLMKKAGLLGIMIPAKNKI